MKQGLIGRAIFAALVLLGFSWAAYSREMRFGLDLKGGIKFMVKADFDQGEEEKLQRDKEFSGWSSGEREKLMGDLKAVLDRRLNATGLAEVSVRQRGDDKFQIEIPGATESETERYRRIIEARGTLEFLIVARENPETGTKVDPSLFQSVTDRDELPTDDPDYEDYLWLETREMNSLTLRDSGIRTAKFVPLLNPAHMKHNYVFKGEDLEHVGQGVDNEMQPVCEFRFSAEKAQLFGDLTEEYGPTTPEGDDGHQLAIVVDNKVHSAPMIKSRIAGQGQISGYAGKELQDLILTLRNGSLAVPLEVVSESTLGPSLGQAQINQSIRATLWGFALVIVLMQVYYRLSGLVANILVFFNVVIILGTMKMFDSTMTLPGIAGVLLTIGMSVDANILIYERIREECEAGKSLRQAIVNGWSRAFITIFDSQMTTLITAVILFYLGTGPIRGFAITLSIGIFASLFSALFVARIVFDWLVGVLKIEKLTMMAPFRGSAVDFMSVRHLAFGFSAILLIGGLSFAAVEWQKLVGIDFKGGSSIQLVFAEPQTTDDVKNAIAAIPDPDNAQTVKYRGLHVVTGYDPEHPGLAQDDKSYAFEIVTLNTDLVSLEKDIRSVFAGKLAPDTFRYEALKKDGTPLAADAIDSDLPTKTKIRFHLLLKNDTTPAALQESFDKLASRTGDRFKNCDIQALGKTGEFFAFDVTTPEIDFSQSLTTESDSAPNVFRTLVGMVHSTLVQNNYTFSTSIPAKEEIGAEVSSELFSSAIISIVLSCLAIAIYVTFRFNREWKFGIASIIALVHDVLITVGAMGVAVACADTHFGRVLGLGEIEMNLPIVGVLLTVIGYSINDTIVVFDRIRENLGGKGTAKANLPKVINVSVNQTLSRTLMTSGTTIITCLTLFLIGGKVIKSISFALTVGIGIGTYSSVFIAAPLLILWQQGENTAPAGSTAQAVLETPSNKS